MPHSWPGIWQRNCQDSWGRSGQICTVFRMWTQHINISESLRVIGQLSQDAMPRTASGSNWLFWLSHCGMFKWMTGRKMHQLATTGDMIETCTCSFSKNQEGLPLPPILKQSLGLDQLMLWSASKIPGVHGASQVEFAVCWDLLSVIDICFPAFLRGIVSFLPAWCHVLRPPWFREIHECKIHRYFSHGIAFGPSPRVAELKMISWRCSN